MYESPKYYERPQFLTEQEIDHRHVWATVLRSGKYVQGRGERRSPADEYCCMGVADDLFDKKFHNTTGSVPGMVGVKARKALGLTYTELKWYAAANDKFGWTFADIADAIEKDLTYYK